MDITKQNVEYSLNRLVGHIREMDEDQFKNFINGQPVMSAMIPNTWKLQSGLVPEEEIRLFRLQVKVW